MNIIWEKPTDEMFDKYLILDLEPNVIDGNLLDTWCVVEATKIPLAEIVMLDHWKKLHGDFVQANKDGDAKLCNDLAEHLTGKFGGDLDTFYEEICKRFAHATKIEVPDLS
jgi:hypothetical protein